MAQHHFVVVFDDETDKWFIDYESLVARFPEGSVWFDEEGDLPAEWVEFHDLDPTEKDNTRAVSTELRNRINEWNKDSDE